MYYRQIAILVLINCLLALSAYVPLSTGLMVVCFGSLMSIGAIVAAACFTIVGVPYALAIILGGLAAALCGAIIAILCKNLTGFLFAVTTLGIGELTRVVAINSEVLGGALGYKDVALIPSPLYLFIAFMIITFLFYWYERSSTRRAFAAIRENELLAISLGIDITKHKFWSLAAGGFISGVAGGFYIHSVGILDPRMFGFENSMQILMFAVFGGTGSFVGPLVGATLLTVIPETLRFSPTLRMILYGVCLLLIVVLRPEGVIGPRWLTWLRGADTLKKVIITRTKLS